MKTILASASPRRQELLKRIIPDFTILTADIDETVPEDIGPEFAPIYLAAEKGDKVFELLRHDPEYLIISADTIVSFNGQILNKPRDEKEAFQMLRSLSGNTHKVITGCHLCRGKERMTFSEETYVEFYDLSDQEILKYIETGEAMDKAGAYGIQGAAATFVRRIDGDYYNVVGLPIARLLREIRDFAGEDFEA